MPKPQPFPIVAFFQRFAQRQTREEVARQFSVISGMETDRRVLSFVAFMVPAAFLPLWLCLLLFILDTGAEIAGFRLMKRLDPPRQPQRYFWMLTGFVVAQALYCAVPVLCWQLPDPMAKSYAIGMTMASLIHITTVRTVHLPLALTGTGVTTLAAALGNSWYWLESGHTIGLLISTLCIVAAAYFALVTMVSVHRLHDETLRESIAARAADQAKSRFLAQMSHELRTPLNAILGMGNAELTQAGTVESRERMAILVQSARGLAVMLDDILDLSAVQAGQLPIRPKALDLRAEIAATVAMFRQQVEDAGLTLRITIHDSVPHHARLDGQRLRQCLSNILSNAVKHTQAGLISVYAYEHQPGVLAIKVADSGPGVPEDLREKIFEPFYRGQLNVPGTGLGMSIARTLARRMGGDLTLLPSVSGAQFLLTLGVETVTKEALPEPEPIAGTTLAGVRVLVVDDIATNRLVAGTYLRLLGAQPVEADSGAQALAQISGPRPPHIVLLDLLMPEMDGVETLRRIRALQGASAGLPVIAMSADSGAPILNDGSGPRFDGQVDKPLSVEGLARVLLPFAAVCGARRVKAKPDLPPDTPGPVDLAKS